MTDILLALILLFVFLQWAKDTPLKSAWKNTPYNIRWAFWGIVSFLKGIFSRGR